MRNYIFHPDDWAKEFGDHKGPVAIDGGAILECDQFNVTKPGEYIVVDNQDSPPSMRFLSSVEPIELPPQFTYRVPPMPNFAGSWSFAGIDLSSDEIAEYHACKRAYRKTWSLKLRAREQRRLDWESNSRRRKRRKELQRRKSR